MVVLPHSADYPTLRVEPETRLNYACFVYCYQRAQFYMGVKGLLQLLKPAGIETHVSDHHSCNVGIDGYAWLHRSISCCAEELALGLPTEKHVRYVETRIRMLLHHNITPFMVFDGGYLPAKANVEKERAASRKRSLELAKKLKSQGKRKEAYMEFMKGVDISPEIAGQVMDMLDRLKVRYVVAPYEADAQLAHMEKKGIIDAVISEDSDLLVYGIKRLWTKMDAQGYFIEMRRDQFHFSRSVDLSALSDYELRCLAIINGCDYSPGLPGIGLIKGYPLVRGISSIEELLGEIRSRGGVVPEGFEKIAWNADITFLYQRVYCLQTKQAVMLSDIPEDLTEEGKRDIENYIGNDMEAPIATQIAIGVLDPITKQKKVRKSSMAMKSWSTLMPGGAETLMETRIGQLLEDSSAPRSQSCFFANRTGTNMHKPNEITGLKDEGEREDTVKVEKVPENLNDNNQQPSLTSPTKSGHSSSSVQASTKGNSLVSSTRTLRSMTSTSNESVNNDIGQMRTVSANSRVLRAKPVIPKKQTISELWSFGKRDNDKVGKENKPDEPFVKRHRLGAPRGPTLGLTQSLQHFAYSKGN